MTIEVNLEPYGMDGKIVLSEPTFKRTVAGQDAMIAQCISSEDLDRISKIADETERGRYTQACLLKSPAKLSVINTMCYVESAPFLPNDDEFHVDEFMDHMTNDLYNNLLGLIKANFKPINLMTD